MKRDSVVNVSQLLTLDRGVPDEHYCPCRSRRQQDIARDIGKLQGCCVITATHNGLKCGCG